MTAQDKLTELRATLREVQESIDSEYISQAELKLIDDMHSLTRPVSSVPNTSNDIELVFDILSNNQLSKDDRYASEYLQFVYVKDDEKGHKLSIYNPITEQETILEEVKQ